MVDEIILAEEQGAAQKVGSIRRRTGTLVLTNLRLVFAPARDILYKGAEMVGTHGGFLDIQAVGFSEIYSAEDISKLQTFNLLTRVIRLFSFLWVRSMQQSGIRTE